MLVQFRMYSPIAGLLSRLDTAADDVVAPVPPALVGIVLAATASVGVVVGFVTVGTSQAGHEPEGAEKLVTPPPDPPPMGDGTPFTHTYSCVFGQPAKNTGNAPEQVDGTVG